MTYYGGKELAAAFRTVRANTIKIAEEIPENKYNFRPAPDSRSVGQTLAHIAIGTGFQHHVHGKKITDMSTSISPSISAILAPKKRKPRTKAETIAF